jgi:hypothetical protein
VETVSYYAFYSKIHNFLTDISDQISTITNDSIVKQYIEGRKCNFSKIQSVKEMNREFYEIDDNTTSYYSHALSGNGQQYLAARSNSFSNRHQWEDVLLSMTKRESEHECVMAKFVNSLTRSQSQEFSEVLRNIKTLFVDNSTTPCNVLPTTYSELRNRYLDGRKSMTKFLPIPKVVMMINHSYISITSCIVDFILRNENQFDSTRDWRNYYMSSNYDANNLSLKNSKRVKEIVDKAMKREEEQNNLMVPLFLKMWSDDFDPNKSVKNNRQSVWLKTVTIFGFSNNNEIIERTYPIGLSKKGVNHAELDDRLSKEIDRIKNGKKLVTMYSRGHQKQVSVYVDIYCIMNDQPEKRKNLMLAGGGSTYHKRTGFVLDYKQLRNVIRSCDRCKDSIMQEYVDIVTKKNIQMEERKL